MKRTFVLTMVIVAVAFIPVSATIINVPADCPTIQCGIDSSSGGDTVLVQPDTYVENINFNGHNIVLGSLFLITSETSYISSTVIDGDSSGTVVTFENGEDSAAVVTGFTIQHGVSEKGGGIYCDHSHPTISNNIVSENDASGSFDRGGGIYCSYSNPKIINNIITGNTATSGAGIYCDNSNPTINDNSITENQISGEWGDMSGGGIDCRYSHPAISDNIICENSADEGGGISCQWYSSPTIANNSVTGNSAKLGGGIYCYRYSNPTISNSNISRNSACSQIGLGLGGGIRCSFNASPAVSNSIIAENSADFGGGISCSGDNCNPTITNCVISRNSAGHGSGISCPFNSPVITNTILWANWESEISGGTPVVTYCDIRGGWAGEGNIDADPLFVDAYNDNYNVCSQSPCIDAGRPDSLDPDGTRSDVGLYFPEHPECFVGNRWYVSTAGNDTTGDGSFSNPFETVQHAVDVSLHGDSVIVENGTYVENIHIVAKNIVLASNFLFSDDTLNIRNTVIDGDSVSAVVTFELCDSTSVMPGFTIRNGGSGGGIRCTFYCSPKIHNNIISENSGNGIYCNYSSPIIRDNTISDNTDGGIFCAWYSHPEILYNIIISNRASSKGGGIGCFIVSSPTISNNTISGNSAIEGGGICSGTASKPKIINNIISGNLASGYEARGGGICCWYSSPIISNNTIYGNLVAGLDARGSAIYCDDASPTAENCIIAFNLGADVFSGAFDCSGNSEPRLTCCDVYGNVSGGFGADWVRCIEDQADSNGNFWADPLFCDTANGDFHIDTLSPCAPESNSCGILIGALDVGCVPTGIPIDNDVLPSEFALSQNYPNPFNPSTIIEYSIPLRANVTITVYNLLGQVVATLVDRVQQAGTHSVIWEGTDVEGKPVSSGIYFYRIEAGSLTIAKKMVFLK